MGVRQGEREGEEEDEEELEEVEEVVRFVALFLAGAARLLGAFELLRTCDEASRSSLQSASDDDDSFRSRPALTTSLVRNTGLRFELPLPSLDGLARVPSTSCSPTNLGTDREQLAHVSDESPSATAPGRLPNLPSLVPRYDAAFD